MTYVYRNPFTSSRPRQGGFAGQPVVRSRRPTLNVFQPRFLAAAQQAQTATTSRQRGFPERVDVNLFEDPEGAAVSLATQAVQAPAHILERPLALANRALGGGPDEGPVHQGLAAIGKLGPLGFGGPVTIEGILHVLGQGLERTSSFVPALVNRDDAEILKRWGDRPDGFVIPRVGEVVDDPEDWIPGFMGMFGIGRQKTMGEFKAELAERGFNIMDGPEGPYEADWNEVLSYLREDPGHVWNFGRAQVNDSMAADFAFRMLADPTNLAFGLGVVGKLDDAARGFQLAWKAQELAQDAGRLTRAGFVSGQIPAWVRNSTTDLIRQGIRHTPLRGVRGTGYLDDMARIRPRRMLSPAQAAEQVAQGAAGQGTVRGLGALARQMARGVFLPGSGNLARRYARGALRQELALLGVEYGSGRISETLGSDNILSGPFSALHDLSQSLLADRPLSQHEIGVLVSAFAVPVIPLMGENVRAMRAGVRRVTGDDDLVVFSKALAPDVKGNFGRAQRAALLERLGGEPKFLQLLDYIDLQIAFNKLHPNIKGHFQSFDDVVTRGEFLIDTLRVAASEMRERGEITSRQRLEAFTDWHRDRYRYEEHPDTGEVHRVQNETQFDLTPEQMVDQWVSYSNMIEKLSPQLHDLGRVIIGRAKYLTQEMVDDLIQTIDGMTDKDGMVSRELVLRQILRAPALIDDSAVSPEVREFWQRIATPGGDLGPNGQYSGRHNAAEILSNLRGLRDISAPARELFHEAASAEAQAARDASITVGGPMDNGYLRKIYSVETLDNLRDYASGGLRPIARELHQLTRNYNARWTRNGKLRQRPVVHPQPAPDIREGFANDELRGIAREYNDKAGLPAPREGEYFPIDEDFGRRTAEAFEANPLTPTGPELARSRMAYESFSREVDEQFTMLEAAGYKFEAHDGSHEYANSDAMRADVRDNKHLWVYNGGEAHPFLTQEQNWRFRAVHDLLTHATEGFQFGPRGELNAAIKHAQMFSPLARRAMLNETHGQNSWVNFSQAMHEGRTIAEINKEKPGTIYSDQKGALLPEAIVREFEERYLERPDLNPVPDEQISAMRQREMGRIRDLRSRAEQEKKLMREIDTRVAEIQTIRVAQSLRDGKIPPDQVLALKELTARTRVEYPAYEPEAAPALALRLEADDNLFAGMLQERNLAAQLLFDYGPISKITNLYHWLADPVRSSKMARDTRQMVKNHILGRGGNVKQTEQFMQQLAERVREQTISPFGLEIPIYRGITALPANAINRIAREIFDAETIAKVEKDFGRGGFHRLLDESANSLTRRVDLKRMRGQKTGKLERALRAGYWAWQKSPVSDFTRLASKTYYPMFRFLLDPRWLLLNAIEANTMALLRDGAAGTKWGAVRGDAARNLRALEFHAKQSDLGITPRDGKANSVDIIDPFRDDASLFLFNRNLSAVLVKSFKKRNDANMAEVLDALPENHPTIRLLTEKYGKNPGTWSQQLESMLYDFDTKGVKESVAEAVARVRVEQGWTQAEYDQMVPLLRRLTEVNQRTFDDLIAMHHGNMNRSRAERMLNSFWLYWPISYQIKATKWMLDVTLRSAFGQRTNFGGAWTLERIHQTFMDQLERNPDYAAELDAQEDIWFAAGMVLPIVPWDVGVSLNKGVRYVGAYAGFFDAYKGAESPEDWPSRVLEMGPIYTAKLSQRFIPQIWNAIFPPEEEETPADVVNPVPLR